MEGKYNLEARCIKKPVEKSMEGKHNLEARCIKKPVETFTELQQRINVNGPLASMPEFAPVVEELITALGHPFIDDLLRYDHSAKHPLAGQLMEMYNQALLYLRHVSLEIELDQKEIAHNYPHRPITQGQYPYQPTLEAITKALDFFDIVERISHNQIIPLYHSDRYLHYDLALKHTQETIIIPSTKPLTLKDLICIRAAPVGIVGVSQRTVFADAYHNTPKDFWVHDINHNRRFASYNRQYCENHGCTPMEAYKQFEKTINEVILPALAIEKQMTPHEKNLRKLMKALFFEFIHEYAFTPDRESLINAFLFKAGDPAPFEVMLTTHSGEKSIESRRMINNNLTSGILGYVKSSHSSVKVKYFHDTVGPNFITSLFNKLTHSFYDNKYLAIKDLPPLEARTPELVAEAALMVMKLFDINPEELNLNRDALILLAKNQDADGNSLGRVEQYAHLNLEEPALKPEIAKEAILNRRALELEQGREEPGRNYKQFNDDLALLKNPSKKHWSKAIGLFEVTKDDHCLTDKQESEVPDVYSKPMDSASLNTMVYK